MVYTNTLLLMPIIALQSQHLNLGHHDVPLRIQIRDQFLEVQDPRQQALRVVRLDHGNHPLQFGLDSRQDLIIEAKTFNQLKRLLLEVAMMSTL